ncbi:hypothetical protein [Thalassotalea sp. PLHSN55]|uniref:hypothetical protein n=1 Tax=Thalassotalea sp. PLHSN55 TaxID=3435888 RepID=UPI003F830EA4
MSKSNDKLHVLSELTDINNELIPLKEIADRELISIYGLTGMVYRPHQDAYMQVCVKKAKILACLKRQNILPLSKVELVSAALDKMHSRAKSRAIVEYQGGHYERKFLPLKLSKSGKIVQKWAKVWLLHHTNGKIDSQWESQVREIWPTYFLISIVDL